MPKAGPETSKTIKRSEVWWIKLTKLYQATPIYKIPKWTLSKINNLPPYVDKSTLGILVFTSLVFAGVYGQNEYVYQTQAKLHTENNYPFDALKVIESDMRLKYAFGGEVIFDGITKNAVSEYDEDPVDHTVRQERLVGVGMGVGVGVGVGLKDPRLDLTRNWLKIVIFGDLS